MSKLINNKKIRLNYEILEEIEAGIELLGFEVKSLRERHGSLDGAHVSIRGNEAFLLNAHIPPYQQSNTPNEYDPYRARKLLLHKNEIKKLISVEKQGGLTTVPLSMYTKGRNVKVGIGIAKGKKKYDKRQAIKQREDERNIRRTLKREY